ncbi:FecR family protein, partial [Shimia aestuarii]
MAYDKFEVVELTAEIISLPPSTDGRTVVPDAPLLFNGEFERQGHDLYIHNKGSATLRIADYFSQGQPADLYAPNGAVLKGNIVERLAGPEAPGQYAQVGDVAKTGAIGQVEAVDGNAFVERASGIREQLDVGSKVFQNDILITDQSGKLSVTFVDGTIFTLSSGSRMVIDDLVYDSNSNSNSGGFSLVQGGFVFIAGQVAKTGGMQVDTPSSTMGIRGTTVVVHVQTQNGVVTTEVSLTRDMDGSVGQIELFDLSGNLIANITDTNSKWIIQGGDGDTVEEPRNSSDDAEDNVIIADAMAALQSALTRVGAGQTFVEFGDSITGNPNVQQSPVDDSNQNLDAIDSDPLIDGENPVEDNRGDGGGNREIEDRSTNDGAFDEGRLRIEDSNDSAVITGDTAATPAENTTAASGDLDHADPDSADPDDLFQPVTTATASDQGYGTFTVSAAGL